MVEYQDLQSVQQDLLSIALADISCMDDILDEKVTPKHFAPSMRPIYYALIQAKTKNVSLTEESFEDFIKTSHGSGKYKEWTGSDPGVHQSWIQQKNLFYDLEQSIADANNLPMLIKKIKEARLKRQCIQAVDVFNSEKDSDLKDALRHLTGNIDSALSDFDSKEVLNWCPIDSLGEEWFDNLLGRIDKPETKLLCGIREIDESMAVGFRDGTLTLFVADVGGFKSTMMLNVALNIFKQTGQSVLFCPLEMPKEMVMQKIVSRETKIPFEKLENPKLLTDAEKEIVRSELKKWKDLSQKFVILDNEERASVGSIRAQIEKYHAIFKPKLVVIDYLALLKPESHYAKLAEHSWYGHMCKDIRQAGRNLGFATVSAVQLGREAIKRLRNQKEGKQTVGSDDLRGSHDYSADADNIYIMVPHPAEPSKKVQLFCAKARYGKKTFANDANSALLDVRPEISEITGNMGAFLKFDGSFDDNDLAVKAESPPEIVDGMNANLDLTYDDTQPKDTINEADLFGPVPNKNTNVVKEDKKDKNSFDADFDAELT